jgi:hypothetical protein
MAYFFLNLNIKRLKRCFALAKKSTKNLGKTLITQDEKYHTGVEKFLNLL